MTGRRLGLFGGTFDPPHLGHLVVAQEAAARLGLERVLFLPAGRPPHKLGEPISPLEHRVRMVELAIADNPTFALSLADCDAAAPSYTVDLLRRLRAELGPAVELYFLVGMDSLRDLPTWRDPVGLLTQCVLVAMTRPGQARVDLAELERSVPGAARRVLLLDTPGLEISASELRARVAEGRPIRYLVPDRVRSYIETRRRYRL